MKNSVAFPHLQKAKMLTDLSQDDKADFLNRCTARTYESPEILLHQGAQSPGIFLVAHGRIDVLMTGPQGEQTLLAHLGTGDTAGEIECISGETCIATCRAQALATVLFCPTEVVFEFLRAPLFIRNVASVFRSRMAADNAVKALDQHGSLDQRLFLRLRTLCDGRDRVRANQAHLAAILGCSRQSVNKALGRLRADGIIDVAKGEVRILKPDSLHDTLADLSGD
ncbi:Crp/Fnr family transcriptional regulator [Citreicella sp. C3M06]|uniref:Crp/Fnr family transcriptional regulator n=1 Tax=Citreicella sp. C3M06 TaxID=2841564 RepID=UPI001C0A464A|nr:Crp/Fnr family transcriptional regulator [Citreicella sp. C3M06]MBU2959964.1 Crp/Fnr family transcriptional regulator [Citreicella sp. C3M06]